MARAALPPRIGYDRPGERRTEAARYSETDFTMALTRETGFYIMGTGRPTIWPATDTLVEGGRIA